MRSPPWLFCPTLRPGPGRLSVEESHHASAVLRLAPGADVVLFDGQGHRAPATLGEDDDGPRTVQMGDVEFDPPSRLTVGLGVAPPKGKRWPMLVEKAVEAGVDFMVPVKFARAENVDHRADLDPAKTLPWAVAACKQCRRSRVPELTVPLRPTAWIASVSFAPVKLYGTADGPPLTRYAPALLEEIATARREKRSVFVALAVGPEGDLNDLERADLEANGWRPARWGRHVLRVETAAVLGVAAIRLLSGV